MKYITDKTKNPRQLLQLFIIFVTFSFLLISAITGYGIHLISQAANISEAEHDAVSISRAFLEVESKTLLELLSQESDTSNTPPPRKLSRPSERSSSFAIQAGSYSRKEGAFRVFNSLLEKLSKEDAQFLRVEKIADLYTIRLGNFESKESAAPLKKIIDTITGSSLVIQASLAPERIEKAADASLVTNEEPRATEVTDLTARPQFDPQKEIFRNFDLRMRNYLKSLEIVKIKIFSKDGEILYSTDYSIIGKMTPDNESFQRALNGTVSSQLKLKDEILDTEGEKKFNRDVVETYLPFHNSDNDIIGAFELYLDITRYRNDVQARVLKSVIFIAMVLILIFGILIYLMSRGTFELHRIQTELFKLSSTDGLTGLFNRRFIYRRMEEEFSRIHTDNRTTVLVPSVGCMMIDIDKFKTFNDRYGHQVGDEILKVVATRIEASLRDYDIAGRYGGEEFMVILPNSTFEDSRIVAERIWAAIRTEPFELNNERYMLSVSIGVATLTSEDQKIDDVIKRADLLLYKAKESGRDQICCCLESSDAAATPLL